MTPCNAIETPMKIFYKPTKLTNQNMLMKRNSVTAGDLMKKNNHTQYFRKSNQRLPFHHATKSNLEKNLFDDIFLQQEKMKEDRKCRNLKNILFD